MPSLIMLIGNIGSGKSTVAKELATKGWITISRDAVRYGIHGGNYFYDLDLERLVFATEWFMFQKFIDEERNIILDEINVAKKWRTKYIQLAKKKDYEIAALIMPKLSKVESVKRRLQANHGNTTKKTWDEIWDKFDKHYQKPTKIEGFDYVIKYGGRQWQRIEKNL
jgi:predicted kinase